MNTKRAVIIVAGGKGMRMGSDIPKQFIPIGGRPILMRTIEAFCSLKDMQIVVVLPPSQQGYWKLLCEEYLFSVSHIIADGGETRFHSVKNGLEKLSDEVALVGVHDGVRPFVSKATIEACYAKAEKTGAAIPVTSVVETLRQLDERTSHTVSREKFILVQTPQVFRTRWIQDAYHQEYRTTFTDDASVVEAMGHDISLVPGNRGNIKITTPFDMSVAEALLDGGKE